jgi:predicted DNA-binding antitoxin AbrB/MazE fold protein
MCQKARLIGRAPAGEVVPFDKSESKYEAIFMRTIPAIFENGAFKPKTPVDLPPSAQVDLILPDSQDDPVAILKARFPNSFGCMSAEDADELQRIIGDGDSIEHGARSRSISVRLRIRQIGKPAPSRFFAHPIADRGEGSEGVSEVGCERGACLGAR